MKNSYENVHLVVLRAENNDNTLKRVEYIYRGLLTEQDFAKHVDQYATYILNDYARITETKYTKVSTRVR